MVTRHQQKIYRLAYHLTGNAQDAEDLSQEAFVKAYRGFRTFRGDAQVSSWLYRITVNTWIDMGRQKNRPVVENRDPYEEGEHARNEPMHDPEEYTQVTFLQACIDRALDTLSPRERSVFVLRHYEQYKLKEIGQTLSVSVGTVKSLLFRAVQKLREQLSTYRQDIDW